MPWSVSGSWSSREALRHVRNERIGAASFDRANDTWEGTQHHHGRQAEIDVNLRHGPDDSDNTVTPSFLIGHHFPYQRPQRVRVGILVARDPLQV